jgi:hypothetical protein
MIPNERRYKQEALKAIEQLKISHPNFTVDDLAKGIEVEYEHGTVNPLTNITNDDPLMTAKIALAHLLENRENLKVTPKTPNADLGQPDYYDGLEYVETVPPNFWRKPVVICSRETTSHIVIILLLIIAIIAYYENLITGRTLAIVHGCTFTVWLIIRLTQCPILI